VSVKALVADATPFVRLAVKGALEADGIVVCAEAGTAAEAVAEAARTSPHVVLFDADLDLKMSAVGQIARELPEAAVIVLASAESEETALLAVRAGACGFVPKDTPTDRLAPIIRGTLRGEAAIPRQLVRLLLTHLGHPGTPAARAAGLDECGLSNREQDVMRLLGLGLDDRQVGEHLGISQITVRRHVAGAMQKLGVTRREHALELFVRPAPPAPDSSAA
jgi:DNA-binding NarL/FixJ family response regulator